MAGGDGVLKGKVIRNQDLGIKIQESGKLEIRN